MFYGSEFVRSIPQVTIFGNRGGMRLSQNNVKVLVGQCHDHKAPIAEDTLTVSDYTLGLSLDLILQLWAPLPPRFSFLPHIEWALLYSNNSCNDGIL